MTPDRPGTDMSHEHEWRHGEEWGRQARDPDYAPMTKENKMTDRVDRETVEQLLKKLTFEAVNGEIGRKFAGELGRALRALEAENQRIRDASQAVVDRWDTPLWKEAEATGHVINRLRAALAEQEKTDDQ